MTATPTPTPTATPSATVVPAPGCFGDSCRYRRTVALRLTDRGALKGAVRSDAVGCQAGVVVSLWRSRSGADPLLRTVTSSETGRYRIRAPRRPGRYYTSVSSASESLCGDALSPLVRVRRS